jgi:regulatory protein
MPPRVTALVEERRGRLRVELDGEPWRTLPVAAVVAARLTVGPELDRARARELRRELRRFEALELAMRALARRDHSRAGLDARLEHRGMSPEERRQALATLAGGGYVDDARFAAGRAAGLADRGYGDEAIRFHLEHEGVAAAAIEAALAGLPEERQRALIEFERAGADAKAARRLAAKGFSFDSIEALLESHDHDRS